MSRLSKPEILLLVVASVKPPRGDLDSTEVTLRKGERVFLQDSGAIFPVLPIEMITETVPSPRGPQEAREGVVALRHDFWEADVVHLG